MSCEQIAHQRLVFNGTEWVRPEPRTWWPILRPGDRVTCVSAARSEFGKTYVVTSGVYEVRHGGPMIRTEHHPDGIYVGYFTPADPDATPEPSPPPEDEGVEPPVGTVVMDDDGEAWQHWPQGWCRAGTARSEACWSWSVLDDHYGPLTVVWPAPPIPPEVQAVVEAAKEWREEGRPYILAGQAGRISLALVAAVDALLASERASTEGDTDG